MSEIGCIKQLLRLAKWYKPQRYEWLKNASLNKISDELAIRRGAYLELNEQFEGSENINALFSLDYSEKVDEHCRDLPASDNSIDSRIKNLQKSDIYPVSRSEVLIQSHLFKMLGGDPNPLSIINKHDFLVGSNSDVWINLPISYMSNADIIKEVEKLLEELRHTTPEPKRLNMKAQLKRLYKGGVFEYLDLDIWSNHFGYSIDGHTMAQAINGHVFDTDLYPMGKVIEPYDNKTLTDTIGKYAKLAASLEFSDKLHALIIQSN